jgi:hypothetical protein
MVSYHDLRWHNFHVDMDKQIASLPYSLGLEDSGEGGEGG